MIGAFVSGTEVRAQLLDSMDDASRWKVVTPEGVRLSTKVEDGALRLDYEFVTGGGYCIVRRDLAPEERITLPENYEFRYAVRGAGKPNNLEFKLVDTGGENVWWVNRRAFEWPAAWTVLPNKKRNIEFAWGPSGGAPMREVGAIEFAIASGGVDGGGKGTVWIDELTMRDLPPPSSEPPPAPRASSDGEDAAAAVDGDPNTVWTPDARGGDLVVDLGLVREFGGVDIRWDLRAGSRGEVSASDDGRTWRGLGAVLPITAGRWIVPTPDEQARYVKVGVVSDDAAATGVRKVTLREPAFGSSRNGVIEAIAREVRRGLFPRQFLAEATYWTIVGDAEGANEALINQDGQVEVGKRMFSIEPFVRDAGELITWADSVNSASLAEGFLPIPAVSRVSPGATLDITAFTRPAERTTRLVVLYELTNTGPTKRSMGLVLALRPFQVNPPWQRLNFDGGVAPIGSVARLGTDKGLTVLSGRRHAATIKTPLGAGWTVSADNADAVLRAEREDAAIDFGDGFRSGAFSAVWTLAPGETRAAAIEVLLEGDRHAGDPLAPVQVGAARQALDACKASWRERLATVEIVLPASDRWIAEAFKSQLAYILINRDGPSIQPGSRSYERSWARDGSLTASAMLACGFEREVRAWIDWFGAHQFESGKVPCVVDRRGPDPVPEHDSHGQYIWAVANFYRHSGDREFLSRHWPRVHKAASYIQALRAERMVPEYENAIGEKKAKFGLVPESISHEGYSAKPMHSYWDNFFALLGLREAAYLAAEVGEPDMARGLALQAAGYERCIRDSLTLAMRSHGVEYLPGCVELGDFDATSTTVAMFPCDAGAALPDGALGRTFEKYWAFVESRITDENWEGYTPYEQRGVGAFVRLGQPERAHRLLAWIGGHRRPAGWNHWAEVVWREASTPKFIGDMPHTWVGSDFLHGVMSMFAYEQGGRLVLLAGVSRDWITSGEPLGIRGLRVGRGSLSVSLHHEADRVIASVSGDAALPAGGCVVRRPPGCEGDDHELIALPAEVSWRKTGGNR